MTHATTQPTVSHLGVSECVDVSHRVSHRGDSPLRSAPCTSRARLSAFHLEDLSQDRLSAHILLTAPWLSTFALCGEHVAAGPTEIAPD